MKSNRRLPMAVYMAMSPSELPPEQLQWMGGQAWATPTMGGSDLPGKGIEQTMWWLYCQRWGHIKMWKCWKETKVPAKLPLQQVCGQTNSSASSNTGLCSLKPKENEKVATFRGTKEKCVTFPNTKIQPHLTEIWHAFGEQKSAT